MRSSRSGRASGAEKTMRGRMAATQRNAAAAMAEVMSVILRTRRASERSFATKLSKSALKKSMGSQAMARKRRARWGKLW
ncbi:hypothetical protein [Tunturiibacter gelidiferens]|uniref:hypothetical protein n=1 Tax=Tunturiibacter gelidiferens TaxID=3069689 RepID=UPI003D9B64FD